MEWVFNVPSAGSYSLNFRTAGAADNIAGEVMVNGVVVNSSLAFPNTGSWNAVWMVTTQSGVSLNAGNNTIRLTDAGNNEPQMDQLEVVSE